MQKNTINYSTENSIGGAETVPGNPNPTEKLGNALKHPCEPPANANDPYNGTSKLIEAGGFSALYAGYATNKTDQADNYGKLSYFWTSSSYDNIRSWYRVLWIGHSKITRDKSSGDPTSLDGNSRRLLFPVRCKKN